MRMWMPSAGMVQPVAMAMVVVDAVICGRGGEAGDVGVSDSWGDTDTSVGAGNARATAASGAVSGASIAPAVAHAVIAARSVSVMLE